MNFDPGPLVEWTPQGLYCRRGDFYIDPQRGVNTAIITHAHSDHARRGSQHYFCTQSGLHLLKSRLGPKIKATGIPYQQSFQLGEVQVSFHPAGHILGSAQIRIEWDSQVWVVSGDYKREADPSCEPFESVQCNTFITEATFGTPRYIWDKTRQHGKEIYSWWAENAKSGVNSLLFGYSLGKTQRILAELAPYFTRPVVIHPSMQEITECYRAEGRKLAPTLGLDSPQLQKPLRGELILAPPSILKGEFLEQLGEYETAFASGWMQGSSPFHQSGYDKGFVISDHADWNDLNQSIKETGAKRVFVLHRSHGALVRHLRKQGLEAYPISHLTQARYSDIVSPNLSLF